MGTALKSNSDIVMLGTWDRDPQTKECYMYDYFHDSEKGKLTGLNPKFDKLKTKVSVKLITTQYGTATKNQIEYHIQFKPAQEQVIKYYKSTFSDKYNSEYPIGLYIDIPDESGVYRRWLICERYLNQQFVKYAVIPCNYNFQWVFDNVKYSMAGISILKNSYSSGIFVDSVTTSVDNQDQLWLPINEYSEKLYYDQRMIISALMPKPITWLVTKVENIHPFGLTKITLSQSKFDPIKDLVDIKNKEMYADYFSSAITPVNPETPVIPTSNYGIITVKGISVIKYNGFKIFDATYYTSASIEIPEAETKSWKVFLGTIDITESDMIDIEYSYSGDINQIKVTVLDESCVGKVLYVVATSTINSVDCIASVNIEVTY